MADTESEFSESDILQRHRRERKELQGKITNMKHSVPKGDKKRKRQINEEIAKLQAEMDRRHEHELAEIEKNIPVEYQLEPKFDAVLTLKGDVKKAIEVSKAQKRRNRKEDKNRDRERLIAEQEELNLQGSRHLEAEKIKTILGAKGFQIHEIPSDGDCLYGAVAHQLLLLSIEMTVSDLRHRTANFIRDNKDDFLPFLYDNDEAGLPFTEDKFDRYCSDIEATAAWGGHLELRAIASILKRPIEVIQADGQPLLLGEEFKSDQLTITYHRHAYGLGEHFNSVVAASEPKEIDDEYS